MKIKRQCFGYFKHDSWTSATAKHENAKGEDNCIPENVLMIENLRLPITKFNTHFIIVG